MRVLKTKIIVQRQPFIPGKMCRILSVFFIEAIHVKYDIFTIQKQVLVYHGQTLQADGVVKSNNVFPSVDRATLHSKSNERKREIKRGRERGGFHQSFRAAGACGTASVIRNEKKK
jgi:hypothetical protein